MDTPIASTRRLTVSEVRVIDNGTDGFYDIEFDLDCREAFRQGQHWNAAWVFLKINAGETVEIDSMEHAVELLTDSNDQTATETSEVARALRDQVEHALHWFGRPGGLPRLGGPPGFGGFGKGLSRPPRPPFAKLRPPPGFGGMPSFSADAGGEADAGEPEGPQAVRLAHSHVDHHGQQVEVQDDFAFLTPGAEGAKSKVTTFTAWKHLAVSTEADEHDPAKGTIITPGEDGMGVFIYRRDNGRESMKLEGIRVRTTQPCDGEALKVWVGAIEMVHIPAGDFHLGDPQGPDGPHCCFHKAGASGADKSYVVESEKELVVGEDEGKLTWDNKNQMGQPANIPAPFPKGHQAYYVTKHLITQGEYCDFINHLKGNQITIRFPYGGQGDYRYTVFKTWKAARVCTREERAANWVSWGDTKAYMWWAGLRPVTEMEWEKAARGPATPVANEYAWGSTSLVQSLVILGDETDRPIVQGNCNIGNALQPFHGGDGGQGPVPDDAFRASRYQCNAEAVHMSMASEETFTWREETGGSYYEVMGLSGNLWEYVISAGIDEGRAFVGDHGKGDLDGTGGPDTDNTWPGHDNVGVGYRGGSWYTKVTSGRIADRSFGSGLIGFFDRGHDTGIRAGRTAPKDE